MEIYDKATYNSLSEHPFFLLNQYWLEEAVPLDPGPQLKQSHAGKGSKIGKCLQLVTGDEGNPRSDSPIFAFIYKCCYYRVMLRSVPLVLYILLMVGIAVSRVLILAHFPHQVLAGILAGVLLGYILPRTVPHGRGLGFFALVSLFLLFGALLVYWGMSAVGMDLSWSILLANKWCSKSEWLRPETRPFSSVTRSAGNALGLGFALNCPLFHSLREITSGQRERVICLLLSFLFLRLQQSIPLPISPPLLYYFFNFLRHSLCPLVVIILVPYIEWRFRGGNMQKRD
ncbi:glucose-6-phosphatase 3 [Pseudophryne corroboree]|uniref:glucose-6-phosphatase 3 n=1 Tax=Pseudophryne corroboree TaxID=495146 RepID=UPI003081AA54